MCAGHWDHAQQGSTHQHIKLIKAESLSECRAIQSTYVRMKNCPRATHSSCTRYSLKSVWVARGAWSMVSPCSPVDREWWVVSVEVVEGGPELRTGVTSNV